MTTQARHAEAFQVSLEIAETYEVAFVPSLFADVARRLVEFDAPTPGSRSPPSRPPR